MLAFHTEIILEIVRHPMQFERRLEEELRTLHDVCCSSSFNLPALKSRVGGLFLENAVFSLAWQRRKVVC